MSKRTSSHAPAQTNARPPLSDLFVKEPLPDEVAASPIASSLWLAYEIEAAVVHELGHALTLPRLGRWDARRYVEIRFIDRGEGKASVSGLAHRADTKGRPRPPIMRRYNGAQFLFELISTISGPLAEIAYRRAAKMNVNGAAFEGDLRTLRETEHLYPLQALWDLASTLMFENGLFDEIIEQAIEIAEDIEIPDKIGSEDFVHEFAVKAR